MQGLILKGYTILGEMWMYNTGNIIPIKRTLHTPLSSLATLLLSHIPLLFPSNLVMSLVQEGSQSLNPPPLGIVFS